MIHETIRILEKFNLTFESDRVAFSAIINHRNVLEHFGSEANLVGALYETALQKGDEANVLRHWGSFEFRRANPNFEAAAAHFKAALEFRPGEPYTLHALAEMNLMRAERARDRAERETYINQARDFLAPLLRSTYHKIVALHTQGKLELLRLRKATSENGRWTPTRPHSNDFKTCCERRSEISRRNHASCRSTQISRKP